VQLIKSMNNYLLNEKEKLNSLELQLKQKEKLITDQKMKIENFSSSKPFFDNKKTSKK